MGNQMKPSLEESGNDSTYEDNKNNLNTIYPYFRFLQRKCFAK